MQERKWYWKSPQAMDRESLLETGQDLTVEVGTAHRDALRDATMPAYAQMGDKRTL